MDIRKVVAKIHLSILELATLIMIVFVWYISYAEGAQVTLNEFEMKGIIREPGFFDIMRNTVPNFIGSLCMMLVPLLLIQAKKPNSRGGSKIDWVEITYIMFSIAIAIVMLYFVYIGMVDSLESLVAVKKNMEPMVVEYFRGKIKRMILSNAFIDLLIGLATIYEIGHHNRVIATVQPNTQSNQPNQSNTPPPAPSNSSIPIVTKIQYTGTIKRKDSGSIGKIANMSDAAKTKLDISTQSEVMELINGKEIKKEFLIDDSSKIELINLAASSGLDIKLDPK